MPTESSFECTWTRNLSRKMSRKGKWVNETVEELARAARVPSTQTNYKSHIKGLCTTWYDDEKRYLRPSLEDFRVFLAIMDARGAPLSARTMESTRAAIRAELIIRGEAHSDAALNAQIDAAVRGYRAKHPQNTVDYGPLDWAKMQQLLPDMFNDSTVSGETYWVVVAQWTFGLRVSQAKKMCATDIRICTDAKHRGLYEYTCPRQKGRVANKEGQVEYHRAAPESNAMITDLLAFANARGPPGGLLFPNVTETVVNQVIKRAAANHGWAPGLRWSSHAIRNGTLVEARRLAGYDGVYERGAQQSLVTRIQYAREESRRVHGDPNQRRKGGVRERAKHSKKAPLPKRVCTKKASTSSTTRRKG